MGLLSRFVKRKPPVARTPRVPILTYHAANADGPDYASNDHLALEEDLRTIRSIGYRIADLRDVVALVRGERPALLDSGDWVALTFDDAPDCEYFDLRHPSFGVRKSFYRLLVESGDAGEASQAWPTPTAVSFVIASPQARAELDRACLAGRGHWRDDWWHECADRGVIGIANHSWDHAHAVVSTIRQREQRKGTFLGIDTKTDADGQIAAAARYIWWRTAGLCAPFFAYPYGDVPEYLPREYFPRFGERHRTQAAFTTGGDVAVAGGDVWRIPRFVFGQHWREPEGLRDLLERARASRS